MGPNFIPDVFGTEVVAVIDVVEELLTMIAGTPPTVTVPPYKSVPVIVKVVPPLAGPAVTSVLVTTGIIGLIVNE